MKILTGRGLKRPLLLFSALLFLSSIASASTADEAWSQAKARGLGEKKSWLKLLHFRTTWWRTRSDVDGPRFFLNDNGRWDASAEMHSLIAAMFDPEQISNKEDQSIFCRFPARIVWLEKEMQGSGVQWPTRSCPLMERFRSVVRGPSASLVFSSYYLNNPSSAFGHTFLRINQAPSGRDGQRYELLDYGFNYAANVDTENALIYGIKGMFGGFRGTFTSVPYYYKVREYNNAESRDLWQYELNLTPEQVSVLADHLWELGATSIAYWYLTENCSFHMLTVIEAAAPELDILSHLKKQVIPSDTVQVIVEIPGLVRKITYRPSIRTQMFERFRLLDSTERDAAIEMVSKKDLSPLKKITDTKRQSVVLDASLDLIDYRFPYDVQFADHPITQFKNDVLAERGKNPTISEALVIPPPEDAPHLGHPSVRDGLSFRKTEVSGEESVVLRHRYALHDLYDPARGYPDSAQIGMFEVDLLWTPVRHTLEMDKLTAFEVISRTPWKKLTPDFSWQMRLGAERRPWDDKPGTSVGILEGGGGLTLATPEEMLSLFGGARTAVHSDLDGRANLARLSAGPALGTRLRLTPDLVMGLEGWWRRERQDLGDKDFRELSATFHWQFARNWGFRVQGNEKSNVRSGEIELLGYY